jgi:hypothetical protein
MFITFFFPLLIVSFADIGGATGELLEKNAQILSQISSNFSSIQVIHRNLTPNQCQAVVIA